MNIKRYRQVRAGVALFIAALVSSGVVQNNMILAGVAVVTGMLFLALVRSKTKIVVDEREKLVREKAAQAAYAIFAPTIGVGSYLLIMLGRNTPYLFALGQVLAYLALYLIALYALSFHLLNRKFGGQSEE